jgi:lipopolysaccharide transport system ATP-binding protein
MSCKTMMIKAHNLNKTYFLDASRSSRFLKALLPTKLANQLEAKQRIVLNNINFEIKKGQAVALVGVNGAGKSTLLKMIAGAIEPTSGTIKTAGSLAAVLELGLGFQAHLTAKKNAEMSLLYAGVSGNDVVSILDEVAEFSELGDFWNYPIRTFSTGMLARLAFSVATVLRPEILIVDEALSVGDAYFQHKSFERIRFLQGQGTTLLIVSHDAEAIKSLCDRALLLERGSIIADDVPSVIFDLYNQSLPANSGIQNPDKTQADQPVRFRELKVNGKPVHGEATLPTGARVRFDIALEAQNISGQFDVGIQFKDRFGRIVLGTNTALHKASIAPDGRQYINISFELDWLVGSGSYSVSIAAHSGRDHLSETYFWMDNCAIIITPYEADAKTIGVVAPAVTCEVSYES